MFVEFTVKNYRSIKDEQVLRFTRSKGEKSNGFIPNAPASVPLLSSTVIYGANAAGKSNIVRAMMFMESMVVNSASSKQEGEVITVTPFLFDETTSSAPSEFEAIFINEGIQYQYGFATNKKRIVEEWLIAYPKGRPQRWFSRVYNTITKTSDYKFGDHLLGQKNIWKNSTRDNALFLSTAIQLNSKQLKPVFNWFKHKLKGADVLGWSSGFTAYLCDDDTTKIKVLDFLQAADLGIHDITIKKKQFDSSVLPDDMPKPIRNQIIKELMGTEMLDVGTIHKTKSNKLINLDLEDESDGTQKFFSLAGPWIDTLKNGNILIIDELNNSLHPKLVKFLISLFHNSRTNPNNAQLIFTTHDTSILNQEIFSRDQIWFCEKDPLQATLLFPLTDFSPRKNRDNIEQKYMSGRYGGIPFIKKFDLKKAL